MTVVPDGRVPPVRSVCIRRIHDECWCWRLDFEDELGAYSRHFATRDAAFEAVYVFFGFR
jgi:hypothetical protein